MFTLSPFFRSTWKIITLADDAHSASEMRIRKSREKKSTKKSYHPSDPFLQSYSTKRLFIKIMYKYRHQIWFVMWNWEFNHGLLLCTILFCVGNRKSSNSIGCSQRMVLIIHLFSLFCNFMVYLHCSCWLFAACLMSYLLHCDCYTDPYYFRLSRPSPLVDLPRSRRYESSIAHITLVNQYVHFIFATQLTHMEVFMFKMKYLQ